MAPLADDEEMTELVDADFPRVDLVGKGANGIPRFLIAKQDEASRGLVPADLVRELIGKQTEPEAEQSGRERVEMPSGITVSGSPADIAAFIHKAAQRAEKVSKEAGVPDSVTKADIGPELDDGVDGMDPTVPLAEPDEMGAGDPTDPGSPAWESIDAATAQKWTSILARARVAVDLLAEREMLEAATGDDGDMMNAMDLGDVCCAIDYAIGVLAPFAVAEQSEADCGEADMMAMVGKSAPDPATWTAIAKAAEDATLADAVAKAEGFAGVFKAGRVLSSVNESHIREAAARLNTVLSSLPKAPATPDDGQMVAKMTPAEEAAMPETTPSEEVTAGSGQAPAMGTREQPVVAESAIVTKAEEAAPAEAAAAEVAKDDAGGGKTPMMVVYNQSGALVGIVDPQDITPVANSEADPDEDMDADGDGTAAAAPADASTDMTPMPAAATGTPADAVADDNVTKTATTEDLTTITPDAIESIIAKAVAAALGAQAPAQDIAKQADVAGLSEQVETLKARLAQVESEPAAPKVFTNGQVPPAHQLRGQDQGTAPGAVDVAKALDLKHKMYTADPGEAKKIHDDMQQMAIDQLAQIHRR